VTFCPESVLAFTNKAFDFICKNEPEEPDLTWFARQSPGYAPGSPLFSFAALQDNLPGSKHYYFRPGYNAGETNTHLPNKGYLDCTGGYGPYNPGQSPPEVIEVILNQLSRQPLCNNNSTDIYAFILSKILDMITPAELKHTFLTNNGSEAITAAVNLARICSGKASIIAAAGSNHSSTLRSVNIADQLYCQQAGYSLKPGFQYIPFGDAYTLRIIMECAQHEGNDIAAVILEPVQGEMGVIIPPDDYLAQVRELCDYYQTFLIIDETNLTLGRTGKTFTFEHYGITPDLLCLGRALGGGIMPLGALVTSDNTWNNQADKPAFYPPSPATAPFSCAAAIAAMKVLFDEGLIEQSAEKGNYILPQLQRISGKYPVVKEARGKGLLIGMEFADDKLVPAIVQDLLNHGILVTAALNNRSAIRIEPPLNISIEKIDHLLEMLEKVIKKIVNQQ